MKATYAIVNASLKRRPRTWLVTGAAGFIGSHLVEALLKLGQIVIGMDNFSTGHKRNLTDVRDKVGSQFWERLTFVEGDILDLECCQQMCCNVDYVLHLAAFGSVSRSLADPLTTNAVNVTGFLNVLSAAKDGEVRKVVYASSSSIYGTDKALPKTESRIGMSLSPYAVSKRVDELYADVFFRCYGLQTVGLRYFNVFGPRQDPNGAYAAVIPKWILAMIKGQPTEIYGDGKISRDFCYVADVVQANLLAAVSDNPDASNRVYNVALNRRINLKKLDEMIRKRLSDLGYSGLSLPQLKPERPGDIRHSRADISRICDELGYSPDFDVRSGMDLTVNWFVQKHS